MLSLELRPEPSRPMAFGSPLLALGITVLLCIGMFVALGKDPVQGLELFFVQPLSSARALSELSIKAVPLLLIGLGLALSFRCNVWNIGAEGQFVLGAIGAGGVSLLANDETPGAFFVLVLLAGAVAGMAWAAIVAVLRDRFNASEILVSLMLVYVAEQVLSYLVYGPWKDPQGYNFPQTIIFVDATSVPRLVNGYRANWGVPLALGCAALSGLFIFRTHWGFRLQVSGHSPLAAKYAGFSSRVALWTALLVSGALAGLAGALEVAGPLGQLTTHVPMGYGFAAIIVAFVGRLHPVGVVFAAILMSMLYIGGELSQSRMGLPKSLTSVFQGLLLFVLLACDTLINYRVRIGGALAERRGAPLTKRAGARA